MGCLSSLHQLGISARFKIYIPGYLANFQITYNVGIDVDTEDVIEVGMLVADAIQMVFVVIRCHDKVACVLEEVQLDELFLSWVANVQTQFLVWRILNPGLRTVAK